MSVTVGDRRLMVLDAEGRPDPAVLDTDIVTLFGVANPLEDAPESYRTTFLKLCREVHPDFHPDHVSEAERVTAWLNEAWRTFSTRHLWLEHLILRMGGRCPNADKRTPPDLLMRMLELQEEIETSEDRIRLAEIRSDADKQHEALLDNAASALGDSGFDAARLSLNEASYYRTLMDLVDSRLEA